jgi:NADPH:quinone reductase-like Zn-dependent oxidoreductase
LRWAGLTATIRDMGMRAELRGAALERIAHALADGTLTLPIQTFPIERIADPVQLLREGHVRGKIVITV